MHIEPLEVTAFQSPLFLKCGNRFVNLALVREVEEEPPTELRPHGTLIVYFDASHTRRFTGPETEVLAGYLAAGAISEIVIDDDAPLVKIAELPAVEAAPIVAAGDGESGGAGEGETEVPAPASEVSDPTPNPQPPTPEPAAPTPVPEAA